MSAGVASVHPLAARRLEQEARQRGFLTAWAPPQIPDAWRLRYEEWISEGRNAGIGRLARGLDVRLDPSQRFGWVRSVLVLAAPHGYPDPGPPPGNDPTGRVARRFWVREPDPFALRRLLEPHLDALKALARNLGARARDSVDQGPLPVNLYAVQSGLAWRGHNAMPNTTTHGTRLTVGSLLTSIELAARPSPAPDRCGLCRRCVSSCPTGALIGGREVDLNRCISYWTTAHEGLVPLAMWSAIGTWVYGCDICQDVCPWNGKAERHSSSWPGYIPEPELAHLSLADPLLLGEQDFAEKYKGTAFARVGRTRIARNALIVLSNVGGEQAEALIRSAANDDAALVRRTASDALGRLRALAQRPVVTR